VAYRQHVSITEPTATCYSRMLITKTKTTAIITVESWEMTTRF